MRCRAILLATLVLAGCSGSGGGSEPVRPNPGEPAAPPPGTGAVTIDMAGQWTITAAQVDEWEDPLAAAPGDPVGWQLTIRQAPSGRYELASFGPLADLDPQTVVGNAFEPNWTRNEGDGRLLIWGQSGMLRGGGNVVYPQFVGMMPVFVHAFGVGMGSVDPTTMAGRFEQIGPVQAARVSFGFTATRMPSSN